MQPCLDDFHTTFDDYAEMQVYHARQARESKWARKTVSGLHIEPLDEASPLYTDGKAFAPNVSQVAVNDTAKNLGLALLTENGYLPIRNTAYKSLLDRAKISGSAETAKDKARQYSQRMSGAAQIRGAVTGAKRKGGGIPFRRRTGLFHPAYRRTHDSHVRKAE